MFDGKDMDLFWVIIFLIVLLIATANAETYTLNYSQCMVDNVSNHTYCAQDFIDINITDIRLNVSIDDTAPYSYSNSEWNLSINIDPIKYNLTIDLEHGQVYKHIPSNITCLAPEFPAANLNVSVYGNATYWPADWRYNISFTALCLPCPQEQQIDCKEASVTKTMDYGEVYTNALCGIELTAPAKPYANDFRSLYPGEVVSNPDFGYIYTCQNTTVELVALQGENTVLRNLLKQKEANETALSTNITTLQTELMNKQDTLASYQQQITERDKELTYYREGAAGNDQNVKWAVIVIGTILIGGYLYTRGKKKIAPTGDSDPLEIRLKELEERLSEKLGGEMNKSKSEYNAVVRGVKEWAKKLEEKI